MPAQWVSVTVYAEQYSVSPKTVRKWVEAGLVEVFRVGRLMRVENVPPTDRRVSRNQSSMGMSHPAMPPRGLSSATL